MTFGKIIKTILKVISRVLLCALIFVYIVVALLNTTVVQSFTAAKVADFFAEQWHTKVRIGALSVTPFINAGIKDIYVEDLDKDTLLYASYLEANLSKIPTGPHVEVKNVLLEDAVCHLTTKNKQFNFQFIIDYFSSDKPKEKKETSEPFGLDVKDLQLKNVNFAMIDYDKQLPVVKGIFATNRMEINDINLKVEDFKMLGADMQAKFVHLEAKERCGIRLKEFKGLAKFSEKGIELQQAVIETDDSFIDADIAMRTQTFKTYSSFVDSVYCDVDLKQGTYINLKDACYWNERIQGANQRVYLTSKLRGTISDMLIERLDVLTSQTHVNVNGKITGLTDMDNTLFNVKINDLTASAEDYNRMNLGTLVPNMTLPPLLNKLGTVNVMGEFKGFISEFSSNLAIVTNLGSVDLTAKAEKYSSDLTKYTADINSSGLGVGELLDNNMLGHTTLDVHAELLGTNPATMQGSLDAKLHNCYFNGNNYNDIALQGDIHGYDINAKAKINDENVNLDALCYINYEGKPTVNLDADLTEVNLHKMKLFSFADTNTVISAKIQGGVTDLDMEHLNCNLELSDIYVGMSNKDFVLNNIRLAIAERDSLNTIRLTGDIIDADVTGRYTFGSLGEDFAYLVKAYIPNISAVTSVYEPRPALEIRPEDYIAKSDIDFSLQIKDISILESLFDMDVHLPKTIDIQGQMNEQSLLTCEIKAPQIDYSQMKIYGTDLSLSARKNSLVLDISLDKFALTDSMGFEGINVSSRIIDDAVKLTVDAVQSQDRTTNAHVQLDATIDSNGLMGNLSGTKLNVQGTALNVNDNHIIGISDKKVSLMNFVINSAQSNIIADGVISDNGELRCQFDNVDLALANPFIESMGMSIKGTLNKDVVIKDLLGNFTFVSNLETTNLELNDVYLGQAWLNVDNRISPDIFSADIKFLYQADNKDIVPLQVLGTVAPNAKDEQLDLNISMQNFSLAIISPFISSFASDVEGSLSCEKLQVKGKLTSPQILGALHCNNVAMRVNMLNTKYWLDDDLLIENDKILFKNFTLRDAQSNKIAVNGSVQHDNFEDFDINLNVVADKINVLDTKANSGEMYYGKAYASANITLEGDLNRLNIYGRAATEPGTYLTVPLNSKESAQENDFISFVNDNAVAGYTLQSTGADKQEKSLQYNIDIDLDVTPDAKLYIPMDFNQMKGNLSAAGDGDLKIVLNSDGKFSMIGEIAVDNGTFGVNLMDVMERKFVLQQGSTLTWNGEPAGGVMDITAIYKTKASLSNILGNSYSKPVDVESIIHLTGEMLNPNPTFDVNLPNTDEQTVEKLFMNIDRSSEKAMLEQTASILLTNQFYNSQGGYENTAISSGVASSVMGVAFSQLSGMITNMVKVVDVSLNYTSAGSGTVSDQVDANVSKSFGKWEISLNSSFGGGNESYNTSQTSNIIGDMSAKYKFTDNLQAELFNHSNANDFTKYNISPYTQGAKIIYKKEYKSFGDIFKRKKQNKKKSD